MPVESTGTVHDAIHTRCEPAELGVVAGLTGVQRSFDITKKAPKFLPMLQEQIGQDLCKLDIESGPAIG